MAETSQAPQALGPGEELLQMCAQMHTKAPNAETPAVLQVQPLSQCWVSHSSRHSQALGTLAWSSHAVGPAPKEQQGGIVEFLPFLFI